MSIFAPSFVVRAAGAIAFVWLMAPHQPDLGFGRPQTIETLIVQNSDVCAAKTCAAGTADVFQHSLKDLGLSHDSLVTNLDRVRADLAANRRR